jgi:hypothetical protein
MLIEMINHISESKRFMINNIIETYGNVPNEYIKDVVNLQILEETNFNLGQNDNLNFEDHEILNFETYYNE